MVLVHRRQKQSVDDNRILPGGPGKTAPWQSETALAIFKMDRNWDWGYGTWDCCDIFALSDFKGTLPETNISPEKAILKMIFLFQRWDMLVPWRVLRSVGTTKTGIRVGSTVAMNGSVEAVKKSEVKKVARTHEKKGYFWLAIGWFELLWRFEGR